MDYKIAIPSLGRSKLIIEQTFLTLARYGIIPSKITVFVVEDEFDEYRKIVPENINVVVGVRGIIQQRNFIHNYYDEGTHLICIDDDITDIDLSLGNCIDLNTFFLLAFDDLIEHDAFLFGVYPVWNSFFRKNSKEPLSNGLSFIIGSLYGIRVRHDADLETTVSHGEKEDAERTLRYYIKDGCVLRYNKIGIKTKFFSNSGGMGNLKQRMGPLNEDAVRVSLAFEHYCKAFERKNGKTELKLTALPRRLKTDAVVKLDRIEQSMIAPLLKMLNEIKIPKVTSQANGGTARRNFDTHHCACVGLVRQRMSARVEQSAFSKKHPLIHAEIFRIGKLICPFEFTSVHLNKNTVCPKHFDSKNAGVSLIISFGEYNGGTLVVDGVECNAWLQPVMFNGSTLLHWNTALEPDANKYSLVFYNNTSYATN